MICTREKIVAQARGWIGCKESDGSHKKIIDTYNSYAPRARGYKLEYTDPWCAGFASACAIACGATDIIPTEVGCQKHIELFKKKGIWVEEDTYTPEPGDYIFYDWQDNGVGDNEGYSDHVGIVEKVTRGVITVIEGNCSNAVKRRTLEVNGKYIRGYGVPKYDTEAKEESSELKPATMYYNVRLPMLQNGSEGPAVENLQRLLKGRGYSLGKFGPNKDGVDGEFGNATQNALEAFQEDMNIKVNGKTDAECWVALITQ